MKKEKRVVVVSLGGSLIIPDSVDFKFLEKFKHTLEKHAKVYKFIITCGGGSIARKYIEALAAEKRSEHELSLAGIRTTRMNALFLMQFFGKKVNHTLPVTMKEVLDQLKKNDIVICGGLRFTQHATSDTTAAKLAHLLQAEFINLTNVAGLYTADPRKDPKATLVSHITWEKFNTLANAMKYHSGQHFVLDQQAATIIKKSHIPTYILGQDLSNLDRALQRKAFKGTLIAN